MFIICVLTDGQELMMTNFLSFGSFEQFVILSNVKCAQPTNQKHILCLVIFELKNMPTNGKSSKIILLKHLLLQA